VRVGELQRGIRAAYAGPIRLRAAAPTVVAVIGSTAFVASGWVPGDMWAALARQSAVKAGVGLTYWFGWFGGADAPAGYSVFVPYLSAVVGAGLLGAIATIATPPMIARLVRDTRHAELAVWTATLLAIADLWSGRIPFAVGMVCACAAVLAVRNGRMVGAAVAGLATGLASPVAGAFLVLGLFGCGLASPAVRRISWVTSLVCVLELGVVGMLFGNPGVEPFPVTVAGGVVLALALMLLARPARWLVPTLVIGIVAVPVMALVPNALGSNVERFAWMVLPVAVIATARARTWIAVACTLAVIIQAFVVTQHDVAVARAPESSIGRYDPITDHLVHVAHLADYRLEAVSDGTHTAAFAMLGHATLARGYETQTDQTRNAVLFGALDAARYRRWLDDNAVGFVLLGRRTLGRSREYELVQHHLPYLHAIWRDRSWVLYAVDHPVPLVDPPGRVVSSTQSALTITVSRAARIVVRVHWSRFLEISATGDADLRLRPAAHGWTSLQVARATTARLTG
jgi:hypothetical protein